MSFHEYLERLIEQSEKYGLSIQIAVFDIDNFKNVNDTFGHRVGDMILKRVSWQIREMVTLDDFVARYGGEEFAVIFTDKTLEEAYGIVETIRKEIASIHHVELDGQHVTVSVGLHHYEKGEGKESLFHAADASLYEAKRTGKNKTVVKQLSYDKQVDISK